MKPLRIVYTLRDQDWQRTKSLGILNVSLRILAGLCEQEEIERIDVLANRSLAAQLAALPRRESVRLHFAEIPAPRRWARLLWDNWSLVRVCHQLAPDWVLLPKGFAPLARWPRARVSAYVHDNIFGYYERRRERPYPAGEMALFRGMFARTAKRCDCIVSNSLFTAAEFQRDFRPRTKVTPIGAPIDFTATPSAPSVACDSLLVATSTWPHKLTAQAIAWLRRWTSEHTFRGVVHGYGGLPPGCAWPAADGWRHHGRIAADALQSLETRQAVLVYFSAYEGYGLPPVEAAVAGRRAIASDLPPLRETMPPACLFDNARYESFAATLNRALSTPPLPPLRYDRAPDVARRWIAALQQR